ncbi:unnamed protein product [Dibothriocephalus latus]|uniref:Uncharacterized protein n=1 Tax=Dibothriocephalus latus TaxID=60516 RepID=A0A3P6SFR9_DIBLA|nr:unnamed protein product [Dibothriocephalus latus]
MNFGSFLRNLSSDRENAPEEGKKPSDGFTGGSLFGASSRFLESVTAKTGNLVSDFSQKVDLANKIDTIKRHTSIDKIGQSVLGSAFSHPTPKSQESTPVRPAEDTWSMPPKSDVTTHDLLHESALWKASFEENQTVPITAPEQPITARVLTHEESTERHQNPFNVESKRAVEQSNILTFSSTTTTAATTTPSAEITTSKNSDISQSAFSTSFDRPVRQQSGSIDYTGASSRVTAPVKRQSTTPAYGGKPPPPRPPPPRSGSQSVDDPTQKPAVNSAIVKEQPLPVAAAAAVTQETPITEIQRPERTYSPGDLDYLTRLQCQEIVSAVDTMIAGDLEYGLQVNNPPEEKSKSTMNDRQCNSQDYSGPAQTFESSQRTSRFEQLQQQHVEDEAENQTLDVSASPFLEASDASSASEYGVGGSEAVYGAEKVEEEEEEEAYCGRSAVRWPEVYEPAEVHPEQPTYFAELVKVPVQEDTSRKALESFVEEYVEGLPSSAMHPQPQVWATQDSNPLPFGHDVYHSNFERRDRDREYDDNVKLTDMVKEHLCRVLHSMTKALPIRISGNSQLSLGMHG